MCVPFNCHFFKVAETLKFLFFFLQKPSFFFYFAFELEMFNLNKNLLRLCDHVVQVLVFYPKIFVNMLKVMF